MMFNESEVFTVAEVAERLKCSPDSIYRLVKSGEMDSVTVMSCVRVCGWQLNEWITENTYKKRTERKGINGIKGVRDSVVLTVTEVAERIGHSADIVTRMVKFGEMGGVFVGPHVRICGWQLNEWITGSLASR